MNYNIYRGVKNHDFLIDGNTDFLNIEESTHSYQVFERVFLNVASKRGVGWQSIYHAKEEHGTLYCDLIVCLLLIEKYLKNEFLKTDDDIASLIGYEFYEIIESYRNYLTK
jgi:hypothetical protein